MRNMSDVEQQLRELLDELQALRDKESERRVCYEDSLQGTRHLQSVPLVHGVGPVGDMLEILAQRKLLARSYRGGETNKPEVFFGIAPSVYTAAGILYPDKNFAIVFHPEVERSCDVEASPWDTGAFRKALCAGLSEEERRVAFRRYTLPAPQYREYLVHYVASCFQIPDGYLRRWVYQFGDPLGAMTPDHDLSRSFEVRFRGELALAPTSVAAIFALRRTGSSAGRTEFQIRDSLESLGVLSTHIEWFEGSTDRLRTRMCEWIVRYIEQVRSAS